jgi:hypothetical protein
MLKSPDKMTPSELEARSVYHEANAEIFERRQEPNLAQVFRSLAGKYRDELERRLEIAQ